MKSFYCTFAVALLGATAPSALLAQSVGIGTPAPEAAAALEIKSTTQGLLLPRLTAAQRGAVAAPVQGLVVYQTDGTQGIYYHDGTQWVNMATGLSPNDAGLAQPLVVSTHLTFQSTENTGAMARDGSGNFYISENYTIIKVPLSGQSSVLAGATGSTGYANGMGTAARFGRLSNLAVDASGNVYTFDNATIRKITAAGVVTTLAGTPGSIGSVDGTGPAAQFSMFCHALTVDAGGTVYMGDFHNRTVRKITAAGVVTTLAGTAGTSGTADGTGSAARFGFIYGIAVDAAGTVYVGDERRIRKITSAGVVTTLAGGATGGGDGVGTSASFASSVSLALGPDGNLYAGDYTTVRRVTPAGGVTTLAGFYDDAANTNGPVPTARFSGVGAIAVNSNGAIYVSKGSSTSTLGTIRVIK